MSPDVDNVVIPDNAPANTAPPLDVNVFAVKSPVLVTLNPVLSRLPVVFYLQLLHQQHYNILIRWDYFRTINDYENHQLRDLKQLYLAEILLDNVTSPITLSVPPADVLPVVSATVNLLPSS